MEQTIKGIRELQQRLDQISNRVTAIFAARSLAPKGHQVDYEWELQLLQALPEQLRLGLNRLMEKSEGFSAESCQLLTELQQLALNGLQLVRGAHLVQPEDFPPVQNQQELLYLFLFSQNMLQMEAYTHQYLLQLRYLESKKALEQQAADFLKGFPASGTANDLQQLTDDTWEVTTLLERLTSNGEVAELEDGLAEQSHVYRDTLVFRIALFHAFGLNKFPGYQALKKSSKALFLARLFGGSPGHVHGLCEILVRQYEGDFLRYSTMDHMERARQFVGSLKTCKAHLLQMYICPN